MEPYADRRAAGRELAAHLVHHSDPIVVGVPFGGLVVADEVATMIGAGVVAASVGRVGAPESPNLVVGAVTGDGELLLEPDLAERLGIGPNDVAEQADRARAMIRAEMAVLEVGEPAVAGRDVILVVEGATVGIGLGAVVAYLRRRGAGAVSCAVPVAPPATVDLIATMADEIICPRQPLRMRSIDEWYTRYPIVDEGEARRILARSRL